MKKGFTLSELLGVIVILGLLLALVFPSIVKNLKEGENDINDAVERLIFNGVENYIEENKNTYPTKEDTTYCITLQELVENGAISEGLLIDQKGKKLDFKKKVEIKIQNGKKEYKMNDQCKN